MRRSLSFDIRHSAFVIAAAALASHPLAAAEPAPATPPATAPTAAAPADHPWLLTLSALLTDRYRAVGDLRLVWQRPPAASLAPDADLEILQAPAALAPQILVQVRARDAAGRSTEHALLLRAELWRDGYSLRQPAAVGSPLVLPDLEPARVDTLRERDALLLDPASATPPDLDFARAVPAGRALVWRDVLRRPLVRRGQPVDVVATDGALSVSLRAVALHDAARGDTVRVRNPDSKREFVAVVTSESRATVRF